MIFSVRPELRSSCVSPTQILESVLPQVLALSAARIRRCFRDIFFCVLNVPIMAKSAPMLLIIRALTSPVCAPVESSLTVCAPKATRGQTSSCIAPINGDGGHKTTSASLPVKIVFCEQICLASFKASGRDDGFIFQFPTISFSLVLIIF